MRVTAAVLAGGAARRFGADKLLQPLAGRPLVTHALDAAAAAPASELMLLAGSPEVAAAGRAWAGDRPLEVHPVETRDEGMGGTLREAARLCPPGTQGLLVFLADMPFVPHDVAARLLARIGTAPAAVPVCRGQRGHPVLIGAALLPALTQLQGTHGASALLGNAIMIEVYDDGIHFDIDTPEMLFRA